jgi:hypothetical protein
MSDCVFFFPIEGGYGECHRDRPTQDSADGRTTSYPRVHGDALACLLSRRRDGPGGEVFPVTVGSTSTRLVDVDAARRYLVLANDSGAVVYVKYGAGASDSSWTHRLAPNSEITISGDEWYGEVTAARSTGTSTMVVTVVRRALDASW